MEDCRKWEGHVVVLPYPAQGHINPLLQFAKRLQSKGVKATVATTHYTVNSICAQGIGVEPISDGFDKGGFAEAQNVDAYLKCFRENGSRTLSQLIHRYRNSTSPIDCVVYDSFFPWALDVAKHHGIYAAAFFTNSATVCAVFCHIHNGNITLPVEEEDLPLLLPGLPPLNSLDLPSFVKFPESNPAYLVMKLNQFSNLHKADFIFNNSFQDLEAEVAKATSKMWPAKLIGPMIPSAFLDDLVEGDRGYGANLWKPFADDYCIKWLKTKPYKSVAYVSFGSMVSFTATEMEEIAWGLKGSGFYFLWVVRESEQTKLPHGFIDSTKGKGLVVPWCNQLEMLAHQTVGCFVTHCGWNSTLEGLSLGVPMVGVPKWADQLTDAKFIEEVWKVGVRAKEDEDGIVRRGEIESCLRQVMEGDENHEMRKNAREWRQLAKEAIRGGGSSDKCIGDFVDLLVCH